MTVTEHINSIATERQDSFTTIHEAIVQHDPTVIPVVKPMMGKEMILYEERGYMKYALGSAKNYISLHCMPIYMNPALHAKYVSLMPEAKFQKGCINLADGESIAMPVLTKLIKECSAINIADMLENRKRK